MTVKIFKEGFAWVIREYYKNIIVQSIILTEDEMQELTNKIKEFTLDER
jgi:hypothetical protein